MILLSLPPIDSAQGKLLYEGEDTHVLMETAWGLVPTHLPEFFVRPAQVASAIASNQLIRKLQ